MEKGIIVQLNKTFEGLAYTDHFVDVNKMIDLKELKIMPDTLNYPLIDIIIYKY
jgi:hypothetical protein